MTARRYKSTDYFHDFEQLEAILVGADLTAKVDGIAQRAGEIAHQTAPVETGQFRDSFVVGTAIDSDGDGSRVIGFLLSTDPDAAAIEFEHGRTMNDAMSQAVET